MTQRKRQAKSPTMHPTHRREQSGASGRGNVKSSYKRVERQVWVAVRQLPICTGCRPSAHNCKLKGQSFCCIHNNPAIAHLIREGKTPQIADVLERSALLGMQSMDNTLRSLLDAHLITPQEAYRCAIHKQAFAALQEHAVSA